MALIDDILAAALPEPLKDNFGDPVTYVHKPSNTEDEITAIFSDPGPESAFPGANTILEVVVADLSSAPDKNDEVHFDGAEYFVFDLRIDDIGFALLGLKKKRG